MSFILIRGGGDLASGVALRLHQSGLPVMICELPMPLALRRRVCFASAVYSGCVQIEGCHACRVDDFDDTALINRILAKKTIPVLIDPDGEAIRLFNPKVVVDGRMLQVRVHPPDSALLIGLGPGFIAGEDCDAVIETMRGRATGRVIWAGSAEPQTCDTEEVAGHREACLLRAPADGLVESCVDIGDHVGQGQTLVQIGSHFLSAGFNGIVRGMIHSGLMVKRGMKIVEIDPRDDPGVCVKVAERSLAVAEGVLQAIRSRCDPLEFESRVVRQQTQLV